MDFQINTMFYWQFHFENETQPITYLLNESEDIYWIVDLESEVRSIWDL